MAGLTRRLVVIGADAAGMSAASQARRRRGPDDLEIVAFDRGQGRILRNWAPSSLDQDKVRLLLEFHPDLAPLQDVPDPYYSDEATFDRVLGMIERSTSALFRQLAPALRQGTR